MSLTQRILKAIFPARLWAAMEAESRSLVMRCPCGHETSIWDMGGIRYKAAGEPTKAGRCGACGKLFMGKVVRRAQ